MESWGTPEDVEGKRERNVVVPLEVEGVGDGVGVGVGSNGVDDREEGVRG